MKIIAAKIVSSVFSPLVISILLCYVLVYASRLDIFFALQWSFISILFVLLVGLYVIYGVKKKFFSNYDVSKREERPRLFIFTGFICALYLTILYVFNGPRVLYLGLGGLVLGTVIAIAVNQKIKASIHMESITAFATTCSLLFGWPFCLLFLLVPFVAWSRMTLKRHSFPEVIVGTTIGFVLVIFLFAVVKYSIA